MSLGFEDELMYVNCDVACDIVETEYSSIWKIALSFEVKISNFQPLHLSQPFILQVAENPQRLDFVNSKNYFLTKQFQRSNNSTNLFYQY